MYKKKTFYIKVICLVQIMGKSRDLYKVMGDSVMAVPILSIIPQTCVGVFSHPNRVFFVGFMMYMYMYLTRFTITI